MMQTSNSTQTRPIPSSRRVFVQTEMGPIHRSNVVEQFASRKVR